MGLGPNRVRAIELRAWNLVPGLSGLPSKGDVMTQAQANIGVVGLAAMGASLSRNLARHGNTVAVYNRHYSRTETLIRDHGQEGSFVPAKTLQEFVASLTKPRTAIIMVKAGEPTDQMINDLADLMEPGDIIVDAGNAYFKDTIRREKAIRARGLHFVGCGVSGGEQGALLPSGDAAAHEVQPTGPNGLLPADGVLEVGIAGINDDVSRLHQVSQVIDHLVGGLPGLDHDDGRARLGQRGHELLQGLGRNEAAFLAMVADEGLGTRIVAVVDCHGIAVPGQVPRQAGTHGGQTHDSDIGLSLCHHITFRR